MANTKIRLIMFSAAKDGKAVYSQQKQDLELTVAQIMSCREHNQSDFGVDHLVKSMFRVFSCVVGRGCLL